MSDVTQILSSIESGDQQASEKLLPLVYDELRKLAAARMANERPEHTLQATALVHEAYLRLVDVERAQHWDSRGHFFAAAAEAMRRILVEGARAKASRRPGPERHMIDIDSVGITVNASPDVLLDLDEALTALANHDPAAAAVVKLRYFAALSIEQAAQSLGISTRTAYRHWNYARAWLCAELLDQRE
jgi:RNA polymerase sigma factor (TIGR02999 family)